MKKIKERIISLGLNLKKEISIMIIVFSVGILCSLCSYILTKQLVLLIVLILFVVRSQKNNQDIQSYYQ